MPRIKRTLKEIERFSSADREVLDEFISENPEVKEKIEQIKVIFKDHFSFDENEIEIYINNICKSLETRAVSDFLELYRAFAENDIKDFDYSERCRIARGVVDSSLEVFLKENSKVHDEFIDVLREAKRHGIDPFKLAIKTNMQFANIDKFNSSIDALVKRRYIDVKTKEQKELFSEDELKSLIEKCATIAYNANEETIQQTLDVLNNFFYDEKEGKYVYDVREILKSVPSLLYTNPKDLKDTIDFLTTFNQMDKSELLDRIRLAPSILTVKISKIFSISDKMSKIVERIIKSKPSDKLTKEQKQPKYVDDWTNKFAFDINKMTQLRSIKPETLESTSKVLEKYLGPDNALTCLSNITVLTTNPYVLEYFLASIVQEEKISQTNLRQLFVESPHLVLSRYESVAEEYTRERPSATRSPREAITVSEFPTVNVSNEELMSLRRRLGSKNAGLTQELLDKIRLLNEEKKKIKEEFERKLKEEKEKEQQALSQEASDNIELTQFQIAEEEQVDSPVETAEVAEIEKEPELTIEELQAKHRESFSLPKIERFSPSSFPEVFDVVLEPIIKGFSENHYFNKDLPIFEQVSKSFERFMNAFFDSLDVHEKIMTLSNKLHFYVYDDEAKHSKKIVSELKNTLPSGNNLLVELVDALNYICSKSIITNRDFVNAILDIKHSAKKKNKDFYDEFDLDRDKNLFYLIKQYQAALKKYCLKLKGVAADFYGDLSETYSQNVNFVSYVDELKSFLNTSLNPQAHNCLEIKMYILPYIEMIARELADTGILKPNTNASNNAMPLEVNGTLAERYGLREQDVRNFLTSFQILLDSNDRALGIKFAFETNSEYVRLVYSDNESFVIGPKDSCYSGKPADIYFPELGHFHKIEENQ